MRMLSFLLVLSIIIGLFLGVHSGVPQSPLSDGDLNLLLYIRFPRIIGACIIGAGIATAGTAYQSAFKNPIVTPGITQTFPPIQTLLPTLIGFAYSNPLFLV